MSCVGAHLAEFTIEYSDAELFLWFSENSLSYLLTSSPYETA